MARILLVDDDIYIRELYEDLLKDEGYEIVTAGDGEQALQEALKGGFDIILMDIIMPKKDGITFVKEYMKQTPQKPNGKIVMLTVLNEDPLIKSCLEQGASGYLIKSQLNPDQILKEIKLYLDKS